MKISLISQLIIIFVVTQLIGLAVGSALIGAIAAGDIEQPTIITDNPEDVENAIGLFVYIIVFTVILLIAIKFLKGAFLFRLLEAFVVFIASLIVFGVFLPGLELLFAVLLVALRFAIPRNVMLRNATAVIAIAGVGSLIGISMGLLPVLIFLVLLSAYDLIAVFGTKHMVTLAKGITKRNLAFTVALPTEEHQFELGTGDLAMPLMLAVSVMRSYSAVGYPLYLVPAAAVLLGSLVGLILTMSYISKRVGIALPALPPQTLCMVVALLIVKLAWL